jgi:hypothetical protein
MIRKTGSTYQFTHDKFITYFLVPLFKTERYWENIEYLKYMHIWDVHLELGKQLSLDDARKLFRLIVTESSRSKIYELRKKYKIVLAYRLIQK